ncbi:MAG: aminoacetone oxidase family FAD-binding enzyme [Helicobacteraceae bacterium]|nr:aminoacetone oxidase family FAD-binding enzyme [Helicobacteraceae bacterium]
MKTYDVVILGGGASGFMAAGYLAQNSSLKVAIIEGNAKTMQKVKVSGGGRCNFSNVKVDSTHYDGDEAYVSKVLDSFCKDDTLEFFRRRNLKSTIRSDKYYFCKNSADDIMNILKDECSGVTIYLNEKIISVKDGYIVETSKQKLSAKVVIVASGAESFKTLGATSIGLEIAKSFLLSATPFSPALVGLTLQPSQFWMKELSGISLNAKISVGSKVLHEDLLFAHKGISGLVTLSASLYWKKGDLSIDFLPNERVNFNSKKHISTGINLSKRFLKSFLKVCELADKPLNKLDKKESEILLANLHNYTFAPAGTFGLSKAEVCRGGVKTEELSESLESKNNKGLYFIGEVVDVTGELGGYNFQWAFSSAIVCSRNILL